MFKKAKKIFYLYWFAYKYILKVNCSFAIPALSFYFYLLLRYQESNLNNIITGYLVDTSHQLYVNETPTDNVLIDFDKTYQNFVFYNNIISFLFPLLILIGYVFTCVAFIRDFSSRDFIIKRSSKLLDDVGFVITFCSLFSIFNITFAICIEGFIYTLIGSFIQCTVFLFLLKNNAYGFSIKNRSRKITT